MAERIYDHLMENHPELMKKFRPQCGVGEFPPSRVHRKIEHMPLEEYDAFSDDPLDFEEEAAMLFDDVNEIYSYAMILNRFSEKYQNVSRMLAKGLAKLAGCCVTKAVLEKKGCRFPNLENLEIEPLYRMVSFNFRKCHAAVAETKNHNYQMWAQLVETEFAWHMLAERLMSTEEKIRNIRSGKISADSLIARLQVFQLNSSSSKKHEPVKQTGAVRKAAAYPVNGPAVRKIAGDVQLHRNPAPAEGCEPKHYDSMKQRKKAERLARKQARKALPAASEPVFSSFPFGSDGEMRVGADAGLIPEYDRCPEPAGLSGTERSPIAMGALMPERA